MNDDRMAEVRALLRTRDYITTVKKQGDGCIITYPHPILLNGASLPRLVECFTIKRGVKPGMWTTTSYDAKENWVDIPEYAIRLFIACEVAACNYRIPIDPSLTVFLDESESEKEDLEDVIQGPSTEEDRKKEGFLYALVSEARKDGFPPVFEEVAGTHGLAEGYRIIRPFYPDQH